MKALVLARGKGTRMQRADSTERPPIRHSRRVADTGLKAMIPFRRPFLDYILSALADAGCAGRLPGHRARARSSSATITSARDRPERVRVSFAIQAEARGTADAILSAEAFAGADPFLVLNSDNYYPVDVLQALVALDGPGLPAFDRVDADRSWQYRSRSHPQLCRADDRRRRLARGCRRKAGRADVRALRR